MALSHGLYDHPIPLSLLPFTDQMVSEQVHQDLEEAAMGKSLNREKLEELRDFNRQIQEESQYWRQREDELEKELAKCQGLLHRHEGRIRQEQIATLAVGGEIH
jgi:regulator of PEP synthase PpsR (kinase-PPPase family)